jgi:signal peptidase II
MSESTPSGPRWPFLISLIAVILDQWTKNWFLEHYDLYESRVVIPGFFNFTRTYNTGAAFSMFAEHPEALTALSIIVFGLMIVFRHKLFAPVRIEQISFGLVAGGIIGNLMDRMQYGHVVDFIHWYIGEYSWPIFNIADSCIVVGVGLYMISGFKKPSPDPA